MQLIVEFVLLFLLLTDLSRGQEFEAKVEDLLERLASETKDFTLCVNVAKNHKRVKNIEEKDKKTAATLVNTSIYTQNCPKKENERFHIMLNGQLRSLNPGPIWNETSAYLSQAMDLLGEGNFDIVFSGKSTFNEFQKLQIGKDFKFNQFQSTSKNPDVGQWFACGEFFFEIQGAKGLDCLKYSYYDKEDKVLLKPTAEFLVVKISRNSTEIKSKLNNRDLPTPKVYITLKMQNPTQKRSADGQDATSINLDLEYIHGDAQTCTLTSGAAAINNKAIILLVSTLLYTIT